MSGRLGFGEGLFLLHGQLPFCHQYPLVSEFYFLQPVQDVFFSDLVVLAAVLFPPTSAAPDLVCPGSNRCCKSPVGHATFSAEQLPVQEVRLFFREHVKFPGLLLSVQPFLYLVPDFPGDNSLVIILNELPSKWLETDDRSET